MTSLWHRHKVCRTTQDHDRLRQLSDELHRAALEETAGRTAIPMPLRSLLTAPPVRTAIDPKAVAAACLARAGSLAQAAGDRHEAERIVRLITEHYAEPDYAFYLHLTQSWTKDFNRGFQHSAVGPSSSGRSAAPLAHRTQEPVR
jgi:hypothetical protein